MLGAQSGSGTLFSLTILVLPCQCHSISAPNSITNFSPTSHNLISLTRKILCSVEMEDKNKLHVQKPAT
jgi:hypothetical protein